MQWKLDLVKNDLAENREIISLFEITEYLVLKGKSLVTYLSTKLSFQCYKQVKPGFKSYQPQLNPDITCFYPYIT